MRVLFATLFAVLLSIGAAHAADDTFAPGPLIAEFGPVARVESAPPLPRNVRFKVDFDVSRAASEGELNAGIESAARFLNLHAAAGVPERNMQIAIVVRGGAYRDVIQAAEGQTNPNAALIAALVAHGVRIYLCGQTAAHFDVEADDLLPGVTLALSAMTQHALLQQQGYTLNPS